MTDETGVKLISGEVKWFDPTKGYGFILNADGGPDILLHANVLRNFGRSSVADQSRVTAWVQPTNRGLQATEVTEIRPPASDGTPPIADLNSTVIEHLESLPLRPARVKWFDKGKGFGFANIFGHPDDVFIHVEVLRHSGFSDLVIGEAIGIRVVEGPRGLMAAQITSWDRGDEKADLAMSPEFDMSPDLADEDDTDRNDYMAHVAE
ncbi:cold-shock protein [Paracoccus salsus]|uniref:cold-shock protein n=1 Tax=Paracoccus salsus TaxID=2911061 RepID=UPI001F311F95|nr:cold shock domain-containing protein [Paracoccus salsus]MCF3972262.1 cold shock domain-containing protein [Paracoccus salsus]